MPPFISSVPHPSRFLRVNSTLLAAMSRVGAASCSRKHVAEFVGAGRAQKFIESDFRAVNGIASGRYTRVAVELDSDTVESPPPLPAVIPLLFTLPLPAPMLIPAFHYEYLIRCHANLSSSM